jgi:stage V sporulation protein S
MNCNKTELLKTPFIVEEHRAAIMSDDGNASKGGKTLLSEQQYDGRMVFVAAKDQTRDVVRKITGAALEGAVHGFPVYLFSVRANTVNISTKATCIARSIMSQNEGKDLACQPSFRENRNEVTTKVMMLESVADKVQPTTGITDMTVGSKSKITEVAGAIAGQIREGTGVTLTGVGPNAVFNAVRAVAVARQYLEQRGDATDLVYQPEFIEIQLEGRENTTNAVKLTIMSITKEEDEAAE